MENQEKTFWEKLRYSYRLIIMNNETFEEVGSYRLSLLNVYAMLSIVVVFVAVAMWLLIFYTPIKQYIPGYAGNSDHVQMVADLQDKIVEMEEERETNAFYIDNIKRILAGNVERVSDVEQQVEDTLTETEGRIFPGKEEQELREEMEQIITRPAEWMRTNQSPSKTLEAEFFTLPVSGEITKGFDAKKRHFGTDVAAPVNTAVKAVLEGHVIFADWTMETGNVVAIQHENNLVTLYKHNANLLTKLGAHVKAGEAIAVIGNTGTQTTGPHLHFEIWYNGRPIDAADYLTFY